MYLIEESNLISSLSRPQCRLKTLKVIAGEGGRRPGEGRQINLTSNNRVNKRYRMKCFWDSEAFKERGKVFEGRQINLTSNNRVNKRYRMKCFWDSEAFKERKSILNNNFLAEGMFPHPAFGHPLPQLLSVILIGSEGGRGNLDGINIC